MTKKQIILSLIILFLLSFLVSFIITKYITYQKERLLNRKKEIISSLSSSKIDVQETKDLEKELHDIIIKLAQIK